MSRIGRTIDSSLRKALFFQRPSRGSENAMTESMNPSTSLNGLSSNNYLSSMLSHQLTTNSLNKSTAQAAKSPDPSPFAQLLNEASANMGGNTAPSKGSTGSRLLQNIMSMF